MQEEYGPPLWYAVNKWVVWGLLTGVGFLYLGILAYLMRRARRRGTLPMPWEGVKY